MCFDDLFCKERGELFLNCLQSDNFQLDQTHSTDVQSTAEGLPETVQILIQSNCIWVNLALQENVLVNCFCQVFYRNFHYFYGFQDILMDSI